MGLSFAQSSIYVVGMGTVVTTNYWGKLNFSKRERKKKASKMYPKCPSNNDEFFPFPNL
jgi:hypothetical protein